MKKFRLIIFSIFAIVASLALTSNVFAYYKDELVGEFTESSSQYNKKTVHTNYRYRWSDGENRWYDSQSSASKNKSSYTWYTTNKYYVKKDGVDTNIYCIDKHRHAGNQKAQMKVARVLDQTDPKDAVILKIMSEPGYDYFARVIAIRAFSGFMKDYDTVANEAACGNLNSGINWAAEKDVKEATATIFGFKKASDVTASSLREINGVKNKTQSNKWVKNNRLEGLKNKKKYKYACRVEITLKESDTTVKNAKKLYKIALNYGAEVANGKINEPRKLSNTNFEVDKSQNESLVENDVRYAKRVITGSITFKNFNTELDLKDSKGNKIQDVVNIVVTPDTNNYASGIKYEYQVAGTNTWTEFNANTDFKNVFTSEKVVLNIRATIKVPTSKTNVSINFLIRVNYVDEKAISGALLTNSKNPYPNTQRYYILNSTPNQSYQIPATIKVPVLTCDNNVPNKNDVAAYKDYINTCCRPNNDEEYSLVNDCKAKLDEASTEEEKEKIRNTYKPCILKAEYCDLCNTNIDVPKTCSDFSEGEFEKGKTATISGPKDIKVCVMDGSDEANNSYKLTKNVSVNGNDSYSFSDNKYCKVSCKEDYSFDLPTGRYVISGRYFELQMGVSATKTCYTDMIDYQTFEKDLAEKGNTLNNYISSGQATVLNKEFVKAYADYRKVITDIEACSLGWDNSYAKNPDISFDYDEEYIEKLLGGDLKFVPAGDQKTTETKWFCNGSDVDRTYSNCIGAGATSEAKTTTINVKECTTTNATTYSCKNVSKQIPTTRYAKVTTEFKSTYSPESVFFTKYSTGVIDVNKGSDGKYTKLDKYLDSKIDENIKIKVAGLPVSLKDEKGVYNYNIKFDNVGEFFDQDGFGRLLGTKKSTTLANDKTTFGGTYVCSYVVNCPNCKVTCKEDPSRGIFCSLDTKDQPQCVGTCAYDKGYGELYSVQQISVTNFNPTERTLGANLNTEKGQALIQTITDKGESIYNDPEYSFTFTPAAISFLRNVNANSENGYLGEPKDSDMNCNLYSDIMIERASSPEEKAKYEAIKGTDKDYTICQSTVLDKLADMNGVKAHSLEDSREKIQSWLESDYCKNDNNICLLVGNIGPAWK